MFVRIFCLLLLALASATAFSGLPMARTSSVQMSMDRRQAAFTVLGGLAAVVAGADASFAGVPEFVKCPAPEGTCEEWKKGKAPSPTFAQVRESSAFFGKSAMLNSIPKVKGVLLQSTNYKPTK